jgi:hypothetical protein
LCHSRSTLVWKLIASNIILPLISNWFYFITENNGSSFMQYNSSTANYPPKLSIHLTITSSYIFVWHNMVETQEHLYRLWRAPLFVSFGELVYKWNIFSNFNLLSESKIIFKWHCIIVFPSVVQLNVVGYFLYDVASSFYSIKGKRETNYFSWNIKLT